MFQESKLTLASFMKRMGLEAVYMPVGGLDTEITAADINRPALQLVGYFEFFDNDRIQVMGKAEHAFLDRLLPFPRVGADPKSGGLPRADRGGGKV